MSAEYLKKVGRHIRDRDFGPATLTRGLIAGVKELRRLGAKDGDLRLLGIQNDFMDRAGLTVSDYQCSYKTWSAEYLVPVRVYEFPADVRVGMSLTPPDRKRKPIHYVRGAPKAIGAFTGPSFTNRTGLPNNGLYMKSGENLPFEDTRPSGQRRGAYGITKEGQLVLMTDTEKWKVVQDGFKGYQALVGTSAFFSKKDPLGLFGDERIFNPRTKEGYILSYLFSYLNPDGLAVTGFALSHDTIARTIMKRLLDKHMGLVGGRNYLALEMEYAGADCVIKGPKSGIDCFNAGGYERRDHYVLLPQDAHYSPFQRLRHLVTLGRF